MPEINFTIKCDKCKAEVVVTDVEQDATIWVDPYSCNCDHGGDVDCGFDDRTGNHSHIWMDHTTVAAYCNELQAEISRLKRLNLIKAQYIADEL
jgi:hypothetical protein